MGRFDIRKRLLPLALIMLAALCGSASGALAQQGRPSIPAQQEAVVVIPSKADFARCIGSEVVAPGVVPKGKWLPFVHPAHRQNYTREQVADMLEQGDERVTVPLAVFRKHAECFTGNNWESDAAFLIWFRTSPQLSYKACKAGPPRREYLGHKDNGKYIHFGFVRPCESGEQHLAYLGYDWMSLRCLNTIPPPVEAVVQYAAPPAVVTLRPRPPIICVVCKTKQHGGVPTS